MHCGLEYIIKLSAFQWEVIPHLGSCTTPRECSMTGSFDVRCESVTYIRNGFTNDIVFFIVAAYTFYTFEARVPHPLNNLALKRLTKRLLMHGKHHFSL